MQEEMKKIGKMFREKREEIYLSLKEVENATSIRIHYLEAIEEGCIDNFLSKVYAVGFIKQYANFLGFDGDKIIKKDLKNFHFGSHKEDLLCGIGTLDVRNNPHSKMRRFPYFLWATAFMVIVSLAWLLAKFLKIV